VALRDGDRAEEALTLLRAQFSASAAIKVAVEMTVIALAVQSRRCTPLRSLIDIAPVLLAGDHHWHPGNDARPWS
jgi:hypothetical protein